MKTIIAIASVFVSVFCASAQTTIQHLDLVTRVTNLVSTTAYITIPGVCTNAQYFTTNYIVVTVGDGVPSAAGTKLNSNFDALTNQMNALNQIPNQIQTNFTALIATNTVNINNVSNNVQSLTNLVTSFPGGNIQNNTVNSNKLDSATLTWIRSLLMTSMNFDSATITSDGSGNITGASFRGHLLDNGGTDGTGLTGYVAQANGDGTWSWTSPPLIPDTAGFGGTTLEIKASDTGLPMYLHVDSAGVVTATGSP